MKDEYKKLYKQAKNNNYALGAFNVFNLISAFAVVQAANELNTPIVMEMSMGVVKKLGPKVSAEILKLAAKKADVEVITHLDHCTDLNIAKECIDEGFKSVMYDGSKLTMEQNIKNTREIVKYCKGKNVLIEGEVGIILGVEDELSSDESKLAKLDETLLFMKETKIDMIAPAVGTAHGLYKGKPIINYKLVKELADLDICPVVIHGGTGLCEQEFKKLVGLGAAKINVSTAIKYAYIDSMAKMVEDKPIEYNPLKFDEEIMTGIKDTVKKHIQYFKLD